MPELPEVENLRRGLVRAIVGQKIKRVEVRRSKIVSGKGNIRPASFKKKREFERGLQGEVFSAIERRAKNLIFRFRSNKVLLAHLKMSGQFAYYSERRGVRMFSNDKAVNAPRLPDGQGGVRKNAKPAPLIGGHPIELSEHHLPNKHTHIIFQLSRGVLYYNDTRMFGYLLYYPDSQAFEQENHFGLFGSEPLSRNFTAKYLHNSLKNKKGNIKSVLMGQKIVTGLGNIYTDECLFAARILPYRPASSLSPRETTKLHKVIVNILRRAIKTGGSSVATYRLLDETRGNYAREHQVYGKAGKQCPLCHKPLAKMLIQSRTTVFCPRCQK